MVSRPVASTDEEFAAAWSRAGGSPQRVSELLGINVRTAYKRRNRLEAAGWSLPTGRTAALSGEVGGPPIPPIGRPPPGFVVRRNSGEYDAEGNLQRQWVETGQGRAEGYELPEGHELKGESALLDANGNVLVRWVKTREGATSGLIEGLRAAFAEYAGAAQPAAPPADADADLLTVYPLPDLHFGMYAWGRETGADYDTDIAEATAFGSIADLVAASKPSGTAVVLGLGDYFHANDLKAATPEGGNRLDVDGRWPKVFAAGARLAVKLVDLVATRHERVLVAFLPGNHDPDAATSLTVALALFYGAHPRIEVYQEPGVAWYHRHGLVLLGATHGHTMKPDRMAMMLAADRPRDWGETRFRSFFFGHIHRETAEEVGGVRIESFRAPAARDAWNSSMGFRSGRALSAITYHRRRGEIGRHRVEILDSRQVS
jgi:hypothetical protein